MKIAYLILGTYNSGGMERVLRNKTNWLTERGYDVSIITTDQGGRPSFFDFSPIIKRYDLGIDYVGKEYRNILCKTWVYFRKRTLHKKRLTELLMREHFDIVVSMFGLEVGWLPKIADGSYKVAEIHSSKLFRMQYGRSGLWRLSDWVRSRADERAIRRYDRFVALTHEDKGYWGNGSNILVIPNATSFISARMASLDNQQVIAVGRLSWEKGYDRLIDAWKVVHISYPNWRLAIFGSGDQYEFLLNRIAQAGLQEVVTIFAPTKNIIDKYLDSSLSVLSSRREGLPMVLPESMACGVPVVAFACKCGPRDIITSGENGLLVADGDIEGLADGIIRMIEDKPFRKQLGQNARKTIETCFTEQVIMQQWVDLFKSLKE